MTRLIQVATIVTLVMVGAGNLVLWYAWLWLGIVQHLMTTEAGPGRAW